MFLTICLLSGCSDTSTNIKIKKDDEKLGIKQISYEQYLSSLEEEAFILYIGRPDCPDCEEFYPIIKKYVDSNQGTYIYYLNIKDIRDASRKDGATDEEKEFYQNIQKDLKFDWVPTVHYIVNGEIKDSYTYLDKSYYEIEDEEERKTVKEQFINEFYNWIDNKFE